MTGVKKILSRYKIPAAATAFCIFFFAGTSALWALTPPPGTPIVNKASARYADTNGNSLPQVEATVQTPVAGAPVLAVSKTASSDPVAMGSIITYSVNVENTGNISSENIAVTDTLSKYLEFQSASSGGIHIPGPPGGGTVSWNIPNLDSGQVLTLTVTARVKTPADFAQGDTDTIGNGTVIPNTISAVSSSASDETTMQVTVGEFPNTVISQSVSSTASLPGGTLVYTIQYGNMGNRTATGVFITNMLPDGTALVDGSITGGGLENNRLITWYVGDMAPGSQGTVSFSVTISNLAQAGDIIVNTPAINSTGQGSVAAEPVYTEITESLASFEIKKTGTPETVLAGSEITYTIEIVNTGNLPITALAIRDAVPEGTDYVSADSGGIFASGEVLWNMGNLGTGETKTVTLILKTHSALQNGALIENKARASAYQAGEQESTAQTSVSARTPGTIEFFDSSWNPESVYKVGDTIYLQVTDPDQDGDSTLIETVSVVLTNETTGDRETIILTETGPATGVFRGSIPSSSAPAVEENGIISVSADTAVKASYTDPLDILPVVQDVAYIDPYGIVFDSVSGAAIAGAVVTIIDTYTGLPAVLPFDPNPAPPAGTDGKYAFPNVPPGTYYLTVSNLPAGYTFPSAVPDSEIPAGYIVANGSRGEPFTLTLSTPPLNIDIPVDPALPGLAVTKTASRNVASIGDILRYSVTIANTGSFAVKDIGVTDVMPHGIVYVKGSSRLNDIPLGDPSTPAARTLVWNIPEIGAGESVELTYNAIVGVDSRRGSGKNTVTASGTGAGQTIKSPAASFTVKINEGIFTSKGTVIGKVFIDSNRNSIHDEKEPGIGNVSVYMQDGTRAVTDPEGKYSIPGVRQGTHVVRLDETTLPAELITAPVSNRFIGSDSSQFVDMPPGGLVKANFALHETAHKGSKEVQSINTIQVASFSSGNSQKAIQTAASLEKKGFEDVRVELIDGMYAVRTGKYNAREDAEEDLKKIKKEYPGTYARKAWIVPERIVYPAPVTEEKEKNGTPAEIVRTAQTPWEKQALIENEILSMTPGLAFLYPKDGSLTQKRSVNVLLKAPLDTEVALYVNRTKTGSDKLGLKVENKERKVAVYEFMAISLNPGEKNILKAEIKDAFGNIRGTMDISITTAGSPHEITVSAKENRVTADGSSSAAMEAYVTDKNGNILEYPAYMTVETSAGEILEKDADPSMPGTQVPCVDGVAKFSVKSPSSPGTAAVKAFFDDLSGEGKIFFAPHLRPMLLVGYGELALGYGSIKGNASLLDKDWIKEKGFAAAGRGAFFLKGDIGKGFLLTAAVDTAKETEDGLFDEHERNTETEDKYPIYGDESKISYEAQSREKLYVRVDKDKSYIMYGDFETGFKDSKLSPYTRAFTGMKSELNTEKFSLSTFLSHTDQVQKVDTIPAKGISGYYYLSGRPVVEGSDMVVIETRDRNRPETVLKREKMARGTDYVADYDIGAILFKSAIPSYDSSLNPVFIIVSYETEGAGKKYYITGARLSGNLFPRLKVGLTGINEQQEIADKTLLGTDLTLTLPGKTTIKAEWARTESLFETGGIYKPEKDTGWLLEIDSMPLDNLALSAYYRNTGEYFGNLSAFDVMRGTEKYGIETLLKTGKTAWIKATYYSERDKLNDMEHEFAGIGLGKNFGKTKVEAELFRETASDNYVAPANPSSREPFDFSEETPEEATGLRVRLEHILNPKLSLALEHRQNFLERDGTLSRADIDFKLDENRKAYLRQEYGHFEGREETRTAVGVEAALSPTTSAFNEYRLSGGKDGQSNQQSIGLRNKFSLGENITGNLTVEKLNTLSGNERQSRPDSFAAGAGFEYLPKEDLKLTSRFEHRHERAEISNLAELGISCMFHPDYSFMLRQRLFYNDFSAGGKQTTFRTLMGLAYRPVGNDRFNALARLEFKSDRNTNTTPGYDQNSYIASVEGNYQANRRMQITGKYAGKLAEDYGTSSYTDLVSGRLVYDITDRFDMGIEGRVLNSYKAGTTLLGGSAEIGYRLVKNCWLSLGYSFDSFDEDLTGNTYSGKGPYLMLRFKLDEKLFK